MNTLDPLSDWLLATTVRASVLAVIILGLQVMLRRWLPASWRHALWFPLLLVLVAPVVPTVPFGIMPQRGTPEPVALEVIETSAPPLDHPALPERAENRPSLTAVNLAARAWMAGAVTMLGIGVAGYRRNLARIKKAASRQEPGLAGMLVAAAREVGLRKVPQVLMSSAVESPAVTGLLRPLLLLPAGFPRGFSEAEARLIVLHELTHLKRHDLPVNWLICVLQSVHWFNPLLWFAFARMRADREAACDAQVLSLGETDRRADYGHALLKLQLSAPTAGLSLGFVGIFEKSSNLRSRIEAISSHRKAHPAWRAGGVAIIGMLTLFGATKAQEPEPAKAPAVPIATPGEPRVASGPDAVIAKLKTIVIPVVKFENTSLEEAVDFIRSKSNELDTAEKDPSRKGVNLVIRKARDGQRVQDPGKVRVTLNLKDVPVITVLTEIAKRTKMSVSIDEEGVIMVPPGLETKFQNVPPPADPEPIKGRAAQAGYKIIIPAVDLDHISLAEAVNTLNRQAKENAKGLPVFPVVLDPEVEASMQVEELSLRNVPFTIAVEYLCRVTKNLVVADDREIRIEKP